MTYAQTKKKNRADRAAIAAQIINTLKAEGVIVSKWVEWARAEQGATFTERDISFIRSKNYANIISLQKMNAIHAFLDLYLQADTLDTPETI